MGSAHAVTQNQFSVPTSSATPTANLNQLDLVCGIAPLGQGQANSVCSYPGTIAGQNTYGVIVPGTGFSITPLSQDTELIINPGGTLATGTLDMPATPSDGQVFCALFTQTVTALTVAANTNVNPSQKLVSASATGSGVAGTEYCWKYFGSSLQTWYRVK